MRSRAFAVAAVIIAAGGCRQLADLDEPGVLDAESAQRCFGSGVVQLCFATPPTGDLVLGTIIDTDSSGLCATTVTSGGDGLCVVVAKSVDVPAGALAGSRGSKPLVIVAADAITVEGHVNVASESGSLVLPGGANASACSLPSSPAAGSNGGGAGGSFTARGGDGGGPGGGVASDILGEPTLLHGGCAGGEGANGSIAGNGGGAIALIAGRRVDVTGQIDASGAGGSSAAGGAGGSGGGSGGMIVLGAPTLSIAGAVFANGGGGGEGGTMTGAGRAGGDPADGGIGVGGRGGASSSGDGGDGGSGDSSSGAPGMPGTAGVAGGGGGGGSVGEIQLDGERAITGIVSPPAS